MVWTLLQTVGKSLETLNMNYQPAIPLVGTHPPEVQKTHGLAKICVQNAQDSILPNRDEWIENKIQYDWLIKDMKS